MRLLLQEIARRGVAGVSEVTGLRPCSVVGIKREGSGWSLEVELLEKESIPRGMDVIGLYRAELDDCGGLLGFERVGLRRRGDTGVSGVEALP